MEIYWQLSAYDIKPQSEDGSRRALFSSKLKCFLDMLDDLFKLINTKAGLKRKRCDSDKALQHTEPCAGNARVLK